MSKNINNFDFSKNENPITCTKEGLFNTIIIIVLSIMFFKYMKKLLSFETKIENYSNCHKHKSNSQESKLCRGYLTDKEYLEHMIPQHQVAIDMSKKLLKNTKNDFMIYLAYRIIRSQSSEIILLQDLLDKNNYFNVNQKLFKY